MKKVPIVIEILLSFMKSLRLLFLITVLPCLGAKSVSPEINALLQSLQKSLPANKSPQNDGTDYSLFVTNIRRVLDAGDYGTAERLLTAARPNLPGNASSVVDELLASIAQLRGEADAKSFSAITAIATEARMKMNAHAPAKDFDSLIEKLARFVPSRSFGGMAGGGAEQSALALRQLIVRWQDYLVQMDNGNVDAANNALAEVVGLAAQVPAIPRSELLTLQAGTTARANEAADKRLAEPRAQFEQLQKKIGEVLDRATSPADLDPLLGDLAKLRPVSDSNYRYSSAGWSELSNRIEGARRFVTRWQDYLNQTANGNSTQAVNILNQLADDNANGFLYPRSKILEHVSHPHPQSPQSEVTISPEEFTLENLDNLITKISNAHGWPAGMEDLIPRLNRFRIVSAQLAVNDTQPAILNARNNYEQRVGPFSLVLAQMSEQLLMRAVQIQVHPPEDMHPNANELVVDYLVRLVKAGSQAKDWHLVFRCLQVLQTLSANGGNAEFAADVAGFRLFFAGLSFERAEQFTEATRSYLGCIRTAGPNLPIDEIGQRLNRIKSAHPDEFAVGATTPDPLDEAFAGAPMPAMIERRRMMRQPQLVAPPATDAAVKRPEPAQPKESGKRQ